MYTPTDMPTTYCGIHGNISFTTLLTPLSECINMYNSVKSLSTAGSYLAWHNAAMNCNSVKHCRLLKINDFNCELFLGEGFFSDSLPCGL